VPIIRLLAALLALIAAAPAAAYWEYTHRMVASIAWAEISPETRTKLRALMREGHRLETPECPVGTFEDASLWADGWIPERAVTSPPGGVKGMLEGVSAQEKARLAGGTVEDWSRDAWENSRRYAYTTLLGDPCRDLAKAERPVLTEEKMQSLIPAVRQQVLAGGLRLARMLDDAVLRGKAPERRRSSGGE
jgi:hypothetical protein